MFGKIKKCANKNVRRIEICVKIKNCIFRCCLDTTSCSFIFICCSAHQEAAVLFRLIVRQQH